MQVCVGGRVWVPCHKAKQERELSEGRREQGSVLHKATVGHVKRTMSLLPPRTVEVRQEGSDSRPGLQTRRRSHMQMEAETGGTWPPARGLQEPPELEEAGGTLPGAGGGSTAPGPLDLRCLVPRMRR